MKIMKSLVEHIREEVDDAMQYAKTAMLIKADDQTVSNVYRDLAQEEIKHAEKLHKAAMDMVLRYGATGREAPAAMREIWDFEHALMIEKLAVAKQMVDTLL